MKYRSGYKYQLAEDEVIETKLRPRETVMTHFITLETSGVMRVKADYAWDGPSGWTWDTDNTMVPSLYHDAAYQLLRMRLLDSKWRKHADAEMMEMLKDRGMFWLRRRIWARGLKLAQGYAADPKNRKKVYEVF